MSDASSKPDYILPMVIGGALMAILLWGVYGGTLREESWRAMRAQAVVVQYVMPVYPPSYRKDFDRFVRILSRPVPADLPASTLYEAISLSGKFLALPAALFLVGLAAWIWRRSPAVRYRRDLDFEGLLRHNAKVFPRMRPVLWLRGKTSKNQRGNYTWPLAPYEWALLIKALRPFRRAADTRRSWNPNLAAAAFGAQLGRPSSSARLFHEDLLLGAFVARILGDKKTTEQLLDATAAGFGPAWSPTERLWRSLRGTLSEWPAQGPWQIRLDTKAETALARILARFDKGIAEYSRPERNPDDALSPEAKVAGIYLGSHHIRCSLSRLLGAAQETGIITTSDFIWVKAVDRCLHYALNDVGRRVASIESSGIRSHMQAENAAKGPLEDAATTEAIRALTTHFDETDWSPPPAMDEEAYLRAFKLESGFDDRIADAKPPMPFQQ